MTIPIIPGPFSFLSEAGQAAGDIGRAKEERKERAQKIAEHASTGILDAIMAGGDPAILDSPETQQILKTAGYPQLTSAHFKYVGGKARAEGAGGVAAIDRKVPERVAAATGATADLTAATAGAETAAGLPQLDADAKAAQARAAQAGANFNVDVYKAAADRFKDVKDPVFKKDAIDAATGVLDARIYRLRLSRENLTLERQQMADKARSLLEARKEIGNMYLRAQDNYEKQRRQDMVTAGIDPDDEKKQKQYEQVHPRPTYEEAETDMFKSLGITPEEYKRAVREGLQLSGAGPGEGGNVGQAATPPAGQPAGTVTSTMDEDYNKALRTLSASSDPEQDTRWFVEAIHAGDYDVFAARLMFAQLKRTVPASKYKKLRDAINKAWAGTAPATAGAGDLIP